MRRLVCLRANGSGPNLSRCGSVVRVIFGNDFDWTEYPRSTAENLELGEASVKIRSVLRGFFD